MEQTAPKKHIISAPVIAYLEICGSCNLKCGHCYIGNQPQKELSLSEWKDVITQLADMKTFILSLGGGEPLIRKDFLQILDHSISEGIRDILIPTNGTVMHDDIFNYLKKSDANVIFMVSLDSYRQEFHDHLRGVEGTYQRVIKNIKEIVEAQQDCALATVITRDNCNDVKGLWDLMKGMNIKKWYIDRIQPIGYARQSAREWDPSQEEWEKTLHFLLGKMSGHDALIVFGDALRSLFWMVRKEPWFPKNLVRESHFPKCEAGKTSMTITATGDVIPCTEWRKSVDSIKENGLKEIWDENSFYQKLRALRVDHIRVCNECEEKLFCGGGCRGVAYQTLGSVYDPDPRCPKVS